MKKALLLLVLFLALGLLVGCGDDAPADDVAPPDDDAVDEPVEDDEFDPMSIPENVAAMENILAIVTELGERMNAKDGYYGDLHDVVVAQGNRQGPEHLELWELMYDMRVETGSTYVYSFIDGGGNYNEIIVDGLEPEDMDPYGYEYEKEPWTVEAFATGQPTVAEDAWMDAYGEGLQKSGFAPIFNSDGEISFLLGVDYPVPELEQYEGLLW